jgi:ribosome modulation factor
MSDVGTNGDSLHCHVRCSYSELDAAYRRGKRDGTRGKSRGDNPYPKPPGSKSRSHYSYGAWVRGFLSANAELSLWTTQGIAMESEG